MNDMGNGIPVVAILSYPPNAAVRLIAENAGLRR